jgi:nitrogen fixation NifU-like protein
MQDALYNEAIIQAAKSDAHAGRLDHPAATATADNPLCGDRVTLDLATDGARMTEIRHKTRGCLLTRAAASLLAAHAEGRNLAEAAALRADARAWLEGETDRPPFPELEPMAPVRGVKSRHDCVTIAFDALAEAAGRLSQAEDREETSA